MSFSEKLLCAQVSTACLVLSLGLLVPVRALSGGAGKKRNDLEEANWVAYDRFGGIQAPVVKATGFFRVEKIGERWIFVTPEGHPFWMRAVYSVDWNDGGTVAEETYRTKYGGNPFAFAEHAVRRLRSWGFNALGEYASAYALPVPTYSRREGNPGKMPFIRTLNVSWYGAINQGGLAPAPFKTLLAGAVDPEIYKGWQGHIPDVFDPNFEIYVSDLAADLKTAGWDTVFTEKTSKGGLPHLSLVNTPWLIGTTPDDGDYLFGFGPGPEAPGRNGAIHPQIGWVIAVTKPTQTENTEVGVALGMKRTVNYRDPIVHAKRAWRDFLIRKYHTVDALNAAWGSTYTTFDSDAGWPRGRGLLDESGRNPWIGNDAFRLSTAAPQVAADLNQFVGIYAEKYFQVISNAIRAATPHQLVFSPAVLNSWGGMSRPQILKAAGKYCDVIQVDLDVNRPDLVAKTYALTGKPMFAWMGLEANPDSAMHDFPQGTLGVRTQQERADRYNKQVAWMFSYKAPDGINPIVGLDWWAYMDKWGEKANWGLVTPRDNAYDGKEAAVSRGTDRWSFPTGGEDRDYGDFLSAVGKANFSVDQQLRLEAQEIRKSPTARDSAAVASR